MPFILFNDRFQVAGQKFGPLFRPVSVAGYLCYHIRVLCRNGTAQVVGLNAQFVARRLDERVTITGKVGDAGTHFGSDNGNNELGSGGFNLLLQFGHLLLVSLLQFVIHRVVATSIFQYALVRHFFIHAVQLFQSLGILLAFCQVNVGSFLLLGTHGCVTVAAAGAQACCQWKYIDEVFHSSNVIVISGDVPKGNYTLLIVVVVGC